MARETTSQQELSDAISGITAYIKHKKALQSDLRRGFVRNNNPTANNNPTIKLGELKDQLSLVKAKVIEIEGSGNLTPESKEELRGLALALVPSIYDTYTEEFVGFLGSRNIDVVGQKGLLSKVIRNPANPGRLDAVSFLAMSGVELGSLKEKTSESAIFIAANRASNEKEGRIMKSDEEILRDKEILGILKAEKQKLESFERVVRTELHNAAAEIAKGETGKNPEEVVSTILDTMQIQYSTNYRGDVPPKLLADKLNKIVEKQVEEVGKNYTLKAMQKATVTQNALASTLHGFLAKVRRLPSTQVEERHQVHSTTNNKRLTSHDLDNNTREQLRSIKEALRGRISNTQDAPNVVQPCGSYEGNVAAKGTNLLR